jgi:hypothetical protein
MWVSRQHHALAALLLGNPCTHSVGGRVSLSGLGVWEKRKVVCSSEIRTAHVTARSVISTLTALHSSRTQYVPLPTKTGSSLIIPKLSKIF